MRGHMNVKFESLHITKKIHWKIDAINDERFTRVEVKVQSNNLIRNNSRIRIYDIKHTAY
jgi:hypothetical protein